MQDVLEFFKGLLATNRWPARWKCGYWSDFHGWLYVISDLMIFLAYFLIPVIILSYFNSKKTAIRFQAVYLLFAAFIVLCGITHLLDAMMFWVPAYRFNALVRLATGIVSLVTVYQLIRTLPVIVRLRTSLELETEITRREQTEKSLAEANNRLTAFASVASHDLQEPVRKIQTYAGMLLEEEENPLSAKQKNQMTKIVQSAAKMQTLIKDLLLLSSISENVLLQLVNPREAIEEALDTLELVIAEKNAVIEIQPLPFVQGNSPYLVQLFFNLISNALKYNERTPVISISGEKINDQVVIRVSDNGIGVSEEYKEKIFEAFERAQTRNRYAGTGIGLAICKRVMDMHKGFIRVESVQGQGSVFILTFPI